MSELTAAARSRSASRASSVHKPIPPGIIEDDEPRTPVRPNPVALPDIFAVDAQEEVAKLWILVRRHKGLHILDTCKGAYSMKFEGLLHQWLSDEQTAFEREEIINTCKRFEIKYRNVIADREAPSTPKKDKESNQKWDASWEWYKGSPGSEWGGWTPKSNWPGDELRNQ